MTKSVVFHIGGFKTGSTSIQNALAGKHFKTGVASVLYPGLSPNEGLEKESGQHELLARCLFPNRPVSRRKAEIFDALRDRLAQAESDIAVISAEMFEYVSPEALHEAIETHLDGNGWTFRVVGYARPHAERFVSGFAERVKHGYFKGTLDDFHELIRSKPHWGYYYSGRFGRWRAVFGDRFILRPMIRDQLYQRDVVADFLRIALESEEFTTREVPVKNVTPSLEDLAIIRRFHQSCGDAAPTPAQEQAGIVLAQSLGGTAAGAGTKLALHSALSAQIIETYREDAEALDAAFFEGRPMTEALLGSGAKAVPEAQSLEIDMLYPPREAQLIAALTDAAGRLVRTR